MASHPQQGGHAQDAGYDDYAHPQQGQQQPPGQQQQQGDGYYHDDQTYYDQQGYAHAGQQDGYYDEQGYYQGQQQEGYQQDGYYDAAAQPGYQDQYYDDQYYDQGAQQGQQPQGQQPRGAARGYSQRKSGGRRGNDSEEDSETFSDFTMRSDMARAAEMDYYGRGDERYNSYGEGAGYRPPSSQISYGGNRSSGASTPVYGAEYGNALPAGQRSREPYPAWTSDAQIPLSKEEIEDIFLDLTAKFGFQRDSMPTCLITS